MFSEVDITLNIKNNRSYTQTINVMGNPYNLLDTSNAKTEYRWNVTTFVFTTETSISLEYKKNSEPTFTTYTSDLDGQNFQAVVTALNNLGIGYFNTYTELGQTYISTNNDNYQFGILDIGSPATTFAGELNLLFNNGPGFGGGIITKVFAIARQSDGKYICVGDFTNYDGNACNNIVRLNSDGTFDNTFISGLGLNSLAFSVIIQNDGKIIVGGAFTTYNGNGSAYIVRINTDGSYDSTFNVGTGAQAGVNDLAIQTDGKIIAVGNFTSYDGNAANKIVRINNDGSYDATFNSSLGVAVFGGLCVAIQTDGKIILGGGFQLYDGNLANRIVRINTNGTYDATFNTVSGLNNTANDLVIQQDGKVIVCGAFTTYNGNSSPYIVRINTDGSYDSTFNVGTGLDQAGDGICLQNNSKIIVVASPITSYNGNTISNIVRINTDGSFDNTFNQGSGFLGGATCINYNGLDNTILVGGELTAYDGTSKNNLVQIYTILPQ
jgi:uncharacterized delta-60 repeat protein